MHECTNCQEYGFSFNRAYRPDEFIEGKQDSIIWIVGLNPAADFNWRDERSTGDLEVYFDQKNSVHSYFRDFRSVSPLLFDLLGTAKGAAHTDIVKCSSRSFPPPGVTGKQIETVITSCKVFLEKQIRTHKPKIIVCNGARVSLFMLEFLPPPLGETGNSTSYWTSLEGEAVCIVLSGFIGRIDTYARRRLGQEIEFRIKEALMKLYATSGDFPAEWQSLSPESVAQIKALMVSS